MVDRLRAFVVGLKRLLLAFMGLVVVALLTVLLLAPTSMSDFINTISPVARLLIVVLIYVIILLFAFWEFRQAERQQVKGLTVKSSGALTVLSVESARERVLDAIRSVPDVHSAHVDIEAVQGRARIVLNVIVDDKQVNIPEKQREINRALEQVIEKQLGLRMAERPKIEISFRDVAETVPEPVVTTKPPEPEPPMVEEAPSRREAAPSPGLFGKPLFGRNREEPVRAVEPDDRREDALAETDDDDAESELWSILEETSSTRKLPSLDEPDEEVSTATIPLTPAAPAEPDEIPPVEPVSQFEDNPLIDDTEADDIDIMDFDIEEEIGEEDETSAGVEPEADENDVDDDDALKARPE